MTESNIKFLMGCAEKFSEAKRTGHQLPGDTHHQVRDSWDNLTEPEQEDLIKNPDSTLVNGLICLLLGRKGKRNSYQNIPKKTLLEHVVIWNPDLILDNWVDYALRINVHEGKYSPDDFIESIKTLHEQRGLLSQFNRLLVNYKEMCKYYHT